MSTTPRHPITGLALIQPTACLVTDEDAVTLARAEAMCRSHWLREQSVAADNDNARADEQVA